MVGLSKEEKVRQELIMPSIKPRVGGRVWKKICKYCKKELPNLMVETCPFCGRSVNDGK